jgi:hypothetical protein
MIIRAFQVSRTTAYQDIVNAEAVFASSTPLNKKYRIGLRIEFIEQKIDELYGRVKQFEPEDPNDENEIEDPLMKVYRIKENEEYITQAIQLEKVLQKYYDIYPDLVIPRSPKTIIYNLIQNNLPAAPLSVEDALRKAGKIIDIEPIRMQEVQNNPDIKETTLNRSQALIHLINANVSLLPVAAGRWKTSGGIGPRILHLSEVMPRSQVLLISDTFERIEKVLLPSLKTFSWNNSGLLPDVDYVMHKKPPEHWTKPIFIPKKYDHVISFASGFCLCEVSLNTPGSGNGFNAQAAIGDEVKYWDWKKFKSEVRPAIRGGKNQVTELPNGKKAKWGDLPEFQSSWFFTDKFPSKGADVHALLDKKKGNEPGCGGYNLHAPAGNSANCKKKLRSCTAMKPDTRGLKRLINTRKPCGCYVWIWCITQMHCLMKISKPWGISIFVIRNGTLPVTNTKWLLKTSDPNRAIEPYYPSLTAKNFYTGILQDYNPNKTLIITMDYQFKITPVITGQFGKLGNSPYTTLNVIRSLHTLHPESIQAAINQWCEIFEGHPEKVVHYLYNQTAIGRSPYGTTFKDTVIKLLNNKGWAVSEHYMGDTPDQDIKFEVMKKWLALDNADGAVNINEEENEFLKKSLYLTDSILVNGKTKKDKSSEKSKKLPPELSTHYPDAFDDLVWGALELQLVPKVDDSGMDIRIGSR